MRSCSRSASPSSPPAVPSKAQSPACPPAPFYSCGCSAESAILRVGWWGRAPPPLNVSLLRVALPVMVVLALTAAAMLHYFERVTGNPFLMPQQLQRQVYGTAPYFLWQKPTPGRIYRHD